MNQNYLNNRPEMETSEYKAIRNACFARAGFSCERCGTKRVPIEMHHIKKWSQYIELRYILSNVICLCIPCHNQVTGKEEQYELEFKRILEFKKKEYETSKGKGYKAKAPSMPKQKWRPRNPWNVYGG